MNRKDFYTYLQNVQTIVIKVGSARVSGEDYEINDFLFSLASDIRELRDNGKKVILVSSGAVSQGKKVISSIKNFSENVIKSETPEKQALAAIGQSKLMKLYEGIFSRVNIPIAQILFGTLDIESSKGYENLKNTFNQLLQWNVLPIVNENDSIAIEELKLGDNDFLSGMVSLVVGADILLILTGVNGFLRENQTVEFMREITDFDLRMASGPEGPGTGGMNTKLKTAKILLKAGIPSAIVNGKKSHIIHKFFQAENEGTFIIPEVSHKNLSEREIKDLFNLK
jgi:glutamate 5-kinase